MLAQEIAKGFVGQLLQRLHGVAPEKVQGVPSLGIKFQALTHGRPVGHVDPRRYDARFFAPAGFFGLALPSTLLRKASMRSTTLPEARDGDSAGAMIL